MKKGELPYSEIIIYVLLIALIVMIFFIVNGRLHFVK